MDCSSVRNILLKKTNIFSFFFYKFIIVLSVSLDNLSYEIVQKIVQLMYFREVSVPEDLTPKMKYALKFLKIDSTNIDESASFKTQNGNFLLLQFLIVKFLIFCFVHQLFRLHLSKKWFRIKNWFRLLLDLFFNNNQESCESRMV